MEQHYFVKIVRYELLNSSIVLTQDFEHCSEIMEMLTECC
jgi:hypothetical protein